MRYFKHLHPICIFTYFVFVIGLAAVCFHPLVLLLACVGAMLLLGQIGEAKSILGWLKMILPMVATIAIANPLVSHKGVTNLFLLFGQWVTLEAICYGVTAGLTLAAMILWFACYQKLMTSDKFLYLFGKIAPATALLISMAMGLIPKLQGQLKQIQESRKLLNPDSGKFLERLKTALVTMSTLLGWSLENTVEQADSMKARGYGIRKRTTFHLFRFESRDARFLAVLLILGGTCVIGRFSGFGSMEFYPRMDALFSNPGELVFYLVFLALVLMPGMLEWKEEMAWRFYVLNR